MTVSGHALYRYFERIEGYDMDAIAKELTEGLAEVVALKGDGKYVMGRSRVTVIGDTVVTVDEKKRDMPFTERVLQNPIRGLRKSVSRSGSPNDPEARKQTITSVFE